MEMQKVYQFYACLNDYEPLIWRRFLVDGEITMAQLGYTVMTLFEMDGSHLFLISAPIPGQRKGRMYYEVMLDDAYRDEYTIDASLVTLTQLTQRPGKRLLMLYDYGDSWEIDLKLEIIHRDGAIPLDSLPRVLEGEGYGIIDDCGGTWGLYRLAEAWQAEDEDIDEDIGFKKVDLTHFDLDEMNARLQMEPDQFQMIYE